MNKELRNVLELNASDGDSIEEPPPIPPTPTPGSAPKFHPAVFGVNGHNKPLLASLAESHSRDTKPRPSHGSSMGRGSLGEGGKGSRVSGSLTGSNGSIGGAELGAPILSQSPVSAPPGRGLRPVTKPRVSEPPTPSSARPGDKTVLNKR